MWVAQVFAPRAAVPNCQCFCPGCNSDLCATPGPCEDDGEVVTYTCGNCGYQTRWLFSTPVPIRLDDPPKRPNLVLIKGNK